MKIEHKSFDYTVLDVFTSARYSGNQLAVIRIEKDLEKFEYDNISREFGYSESSFVYYSEEEKALKIRSFTSTGFEIHGAGHNLLGVVCNSLIKGESIFKDQDGKCFVIMKDEPIYLEIDTSQTLPVVGMMQRPASFGKTVPIQSLAEGLSLDQTDFSAKILPTVVTTEVAHLMVPLKDTETLDSVFSNKKILRALSVDYGFEGVYCFAFTQNDINNIIETRFFNPLIGIDEDPATGSAAGPLAGFLFENGYIDSNTQYQLLQGKVMKQPSTIKFKISDNSIIVYGSSIITMEGKLFL